MSKRVKSILFSPAQVGKKNKKKKDFWWKALLFSSLSILTLFNSIMSCQLNSLQIQVNLYKEQQQQLIEQQQELLEQQDQQEHKEINE